MGKALPRATMEARQVDELPRDKGWQFEPKWDGFRCLAGRDGGKVELSCGYRNCRSVASTTSAPTAITTLPSEIT